MTVTNPMSVLPSGGGGCKSLARFVEYASETGIGQSQVRWARYCVRTRVTNGFTSYKSVHQDEDSKFALAMFGNNELLDLEPIK